MVVTRLRPFLSFILVFRQRSAWNHVITVNPSTEINQLTSFCTEGKRGQLSQSCNLKTLLADRATNADHEDEPPEEDDAEELLEGVVLEVLPVELLVESLLELFEVSPVAEEFESALAAFL